MKSTVNKLSLKWGTLKSWGFPEAKNAKKLLKEYCTIGASGSAILQHDTPRQKEIICQLIDLCDGDIYLDLEDKYVSKDEAKEYVKNYGKQ